MLTGCGAVNAITSHFEPPPPQRANSDATSMVTSFVPPKGAVRLHSAPADLSDPMTPISPNLVDKTAYWQASGSPQDTLDWEKAHIPSQFILTSHGTFGRTTAKAFETFSLPAVAGALSTRILEITAIPEGDRTAIRVDAQDIWIPSKPERITDSTHGATLTANPGKGTASKPPAPVTVTDAAALNHLTSLVNRLPPLPSGARHCGTDDGPSITITFAATKGSPHSRR
jgi:hypothetical protein